MPDIARIGNWRTPRQVGFRGDMMALQVRVSLCRDCEACAARHEFVADKLAEKGVKAVWSKEGELVEIPMPPGTDTAAKKVAFLSSLLDLPVRLII